MRGVTYNTSFFNTIDSPIKAYMLGYLIGDGGITFYTDNRSGKRYFRIYWLAPGFQVDRLRKFKEAVGGGSLTVSKLLSGISIWNLALSGSNLYKALYNLGVRKGKQDTNVVSLSSKIGVYFKDFFRGLFDAEGHTDGRGYSYITMVDYSLIKFCVDELKKLGFTVTMHLHKDKRPTNRDMYRCYGGKFITSLLKETRI